MFWLLTSSVLIAIQNSWQPQPWTPWTVGFFAGWGKSYGNKPHTQGRRPYTTKTCTTVFHGFQLHFYWSDSGGSHTTGQDLICTECKVFQHCLTRQCAVSSSGMAKRTEICSLIKILRVRFCANCDQQGGFHCSILLSSLWRWIHEFARVTQDCVWAGMASFELSFELPKGSTRFQSQLCL